MLGVQMLWIVQPTDDPPLGFNGIRDLMGQDTVRRFGHRIRTDGGSTVITAVASCFQFPPKLGTWPAVCHRRCVYRDAPM